MKYRITKVCLEPLRKKKQIMSLLSAEYITGGFDDSGRMFTMTFAIGNKRLQDIAICFERRRLPFLYISEPYQYDNAEREVENE